MLSLNQYKKFKGNMREFIGAIERCMEKLNIQKDQQNLQRIIRYYINEKILAPSLREGRDYFYNYEHLLKFLYVRKQLSDGWPLNKIRDNAQFQDIKYFEEFFQNTKSPEKQVLSMEEYFNTVYDENSSDDSNVSMDLVKKFKNISENEPRLSNFKENLDKFNPFTSNQNNEVPNLDDALKDINSDIGNIIKQEFISLQLSTSLVLLIEQSLMKKMNYDLSKKIGRAIGAALFHKNPLSTKQFQEILMKHQNTNLQDNLIKKLNKEIDILIKKETIYKEEINEMNIKLNQREEKLTEEYAFLKNQLEITVAQKNMELKEKEKEKLDVRFEIDKIMNTLNDLKYENKESFMNYRDQSIQILSNLENLVKNPSLTEQEIKFLRNNLGEFMKEQNTRTKKIEEKLAANMTRLEELLTEFKN